MNHSIIPELKSQSTWRLLGLAIITYLVYPAHYILRQSKIINQHCEENKKLRPKQMIAIIVFAYLSLIVFIPSLFVAEGHALETLSTHVGRISNLTFLLWGVWARNRLNHILQTEKTSKNWFHGLWSFFLSPLYFNYKINQLNERATQSTGLPLPNSNPPA